MLVALVLVALATGALVATASSVGRGLVAARHDRAATAFALARLDELRAGPRVSGADTVTDSDSTVLARRWTAQPGRGWPDALDVAVSWSTHRVVLATEALP